MSARSRRGWSGGMAAPTTVVLLRHGETAMTAEKRFSGGLAGGNPGLTEVGRDQVRRARRVVDAFAAREEAAAALLASPVRRAAESAGIVADWLGLEVGFEPAFAETEFGAWEGLTFGEVSERDPDGLREWLASADIPAGGTGESFRAVERRVSEGLDRVLAEYAGRTVLLVSHVTPIKLVVARALGAGIDALYRMELSPASVSAVSFYPDPDGGAPHGSLRLFNATP